MEDISREKWLEMVSKEETPNIIDVRTLGEFRSEHIKGAEHLDYFDLENFINKVKERDKKQNYFLYCHSGNRSHHAGVIMEELGFENVFNLIGGILLWPDPSKLVHE